jgi:class 3 adenylate cyclase
MAGSHEFQLRIFLSADLSGSTQYKARSACDGLPAWVMAFYDFHTRFADELDAAYDDLPSVLAAHHGPESERLLPWKHIGDEIVFSAKLSCCRQALGHVVAAVKAVERFERLWREPGHWPDGQPMTIKLTAWLAGFPVTNYSIELASQAVRSVDYLGPSVDLGFRLRGLATPTRFPVTADLGYLLLTHPSYERAGVLELRYLGGQVLRGVLDERPYPLVWLPMRQSDADDPLPGFTPHYDQDNLCRSLSVFLKERHGRLPFIAGDPHPDFAQIPPDLAGVPDVLDRLGYPGKSYDQLPEDAVASTGEEAALAPVVTERTVR